MSDEQIDPRLVQLKLLSDMSKKLDGLDAIKGDIEGLRKLTESTIEEGIIEPIDRTITTTMTVVHPPYRDKPWFGVKITNDGDYSVYVIVNTEKSGKQIEIKVGETWGPHFKTAVIQDILLHTETGSSAVRIRGER